MRFTEAGLRVVAADDAFIYHKGWASYDEAKKEVATTSRTVRSSTRAGRCRTTATGAAYSRHDPLQYMRDGLLW